MVFAGYANQNSFSLCVGKKPYKKQKSQYISPKAKEHKGSNTYWLDELGTPFCITYDFDSMEDGAVTVRFRDTMEQQRVKISDLESFLDQQLEF